MLDYLLMNTTSHLAIIVRWELEKIFKIEKPQEIWFNPSPVNRGDSITYVIE